MQVIVLWAALVVETWIYMTLWYGIALYIHRYDVVDIAWGLGPVLLGWFSLLLWRNGGAVQIISLLLASIWGCRLAAHLAQRARRRGGDDYRYLDLKQKWGSRANRRAYIRIFLLQGGLLLVISIPLVGIAMSEHTPGTLTYAGWLMWVAGIAYEALADWQLGHFLRTRPAGSRAIIQSGLWRYSRHPNYFGEIITWWGAAITAGSLGSWWGIVGAVTITILITRVSGIPPLEAHYLNNPAYQAYRRKTPSLIPFLGKRL